MKTGTKNIKTAYDFERSIYDPVLDHLIGKVSLNKKWKEPEHF